MSRLRGRVIGGIGAAVLLLPTLTATATRASAAEPAPPPSSPTSGTVFIANTGANQVLEVTPDGNTVTAFPQTFNQPDSLAVDSAGDLFVSDRGDDTVQEVATDGTETQVAAHLADPTGVAVSTTGNLFIAGAGTPAAQAGIQPNTGNVVEVSGGTATTIATGLDEPAGIAVDTAGDVFVSEFGNLDVVEIPVGGSPHPYFDTSSSPTGVAVDPQGDIFIASQGSSTDQVEEDNPGQGTQTFSNDEFGAPDQVALDAAGDTFVADATFEAVEEIPAGGVGITAFAGQDQNGNSLNSPEGVAVYAPPPMFTADTPPPTATAGTAYSGYQYAATVPAGEPPATFLVASGSLPPGLTLDPSGALSGTPTVAGTFTFVAEAANGATGVFAPQATITVAPPAPPPVGTVFIADTGNTRVVEVAPDGTQSVFATNFAKPTGVAVDAAGDVYVSDSNANAVDEFDDLGDLQQVFSNLPAPSGVVIDGAGDVFVSVVGPEEGDDGVDELPAGNNTEVTFFSAMSEPDGVAVDVAGDLFAADHDNHRIVEVPVGGGRQEQTVYPATGSQPSFWPTGLAVDTHGDLFNASVVNRSSTNGAVLEEPAGGGQQTVGAANQFPTPEGLALDAAGNLYVADASQTVATKVLAGGTSTAPIGSGLSSPEGIAVYAPPPTFTAATPPGSAGNGTSYSYTYRATAPSGEPAPFYSVAGGTLPPGLSLNTATGVLSGTPTTNGTYSFSVEAANSVTGSTSPATITVRTALPVFTADTPPPVAMVNVVYAGYTYAATVTSGQPAAGFTVADGNLPPGLTLDGATGGLAGTPTTAGSYSFVIGATDDAGTTLGTVNTITVGPLPSNGAPVVGALFVADTGNNRVLEVPPGGAPETTVGSALTHPTAVAVDSSGDVFVATQLNGNGRIVEIAANGTQSQVVAGLGLIGGLAVNPAGTDVFASETGNDSVVEFPVAGGSATTVDSSTLTGPAGLAVDPAGDVFIADSGDNRVVKVTASTGTPTTFATGLNDPTGVALDTSGNVYVVNNQSGVTIEVAPSGSPQTTVDSDETNPLDDAVSGDGSVFVSLPTNNRLAELRTTANTPIPAGLNDPTGVAVFVQSTPPGGPTFTDSPPPTATVGTPYSFIYTATVPPGQPAATFAVASGTLPPGLTLAPSGLLSGTPTATGTSTFVVRATSGSATATGTSNTITVGPANLPPPTGPAFTADSPPSTGTVGTSYSYTYAATVPPNQAAATFALASGNAPPGLTLGSSTGVLSGTPTGAGSFTFVVEATDASGTTVGASNTIVVSPASTPPPPSGPVFVADSPPGVATVGTGYSYTYAANVPAGDPPATFALESGNPPPGLTLNGAVLSGTPTTPGSFTFVIDASSDSITTSGASNTIIVSAATAPPPPAGPVFVANSPPGSGTVGTTYAYTYAANVPAGDPPATYGVSAGNPPPGLTLNGAVLSGTPTTPGSFTFVVDATTNSITTNGGFNTIVISPAASPPPAGPVFTQDSPPATATVGTGYSYTYVATVTAGQAAAVLAVSSGAPPPGLTLTASGVFSGTPIAAGTFTFVVEATDASGSTIGATNAIVVSPANGPPPPSGPVFTADSPPATATVGTSYAYTYMASVPADEGAAGLAISSGNPPPGLTLDGATGLLSGTPTTAGSYTFVVEATDDSGTTMGATNTIVVSAAVSPPPFTGGSPPPLSPPSTQPPKENPPPRTPSPPPASPPPTPTTTTIPLPTAPPAAGAVFATDFGDRAIELSPDGTQQRTIGAGLNLPAGVAVDGSGNLFVADEANNRVVEVAANGTETTVGSKLAMPLGLKYPVGVAVDANDNVFIADTFNNRVLEVPASGAPAIDVGKPKGAQLDQPTGVAVDVKGDVFVTDTGHNQIDELPVGANAFVVAAPSLKEPTGVAVDSAGNLFIADFGDNQVVEIGAHQIGPATTTAGELRAVQCMTCGTDTIGTGLDKPDAVAAGPNNKIFIADATGIIEVDRNTDPHIDIPFGTGIDQPVGIAVYIPATRPNEEAPGSPPVSLPANPNLP